MKPFTPSYPKATVELGDLMTLPRLAGEGIQHIRITAQPSHYSVDAQGAIKQHYAESKIIGVDGERSTDLSLSVAETPEAAASAYDLCLDLCRRHQLPLSEIPVDAPVQKSAEKPKKKTPAPEAE